MDSQQFFKTYAPGLTQQQIAAVERVDGATLLLAVPGSGKTSAIVLRAGYMLLCAGIPARQILTLTFSRAAAEEMKARFASLFGGAVGEIPHFSTIHSFCVGVLYRYLGRDAVRMIGDAEREKLLKSLFFQHSKNADAFSENTIRQIDTGVSYAKNMLMDDAGVEGLTSIDPDFPAIFRAYKETLFRQGKMDFDDQLHMAYRLLLDDPAVLHELQETYRYISVDEAQDTSYIQHRILYLIARRYGNICMVGDEDQSIYGFRAAHPRVLMEFERIYPGARVLLMETNFRSTCAITDAANTLIRHNRERRSKNMRAVKPEGAPIRHTVLKDLREQHATIADQLVRYAAQGRTQAVLYRNNESAVPLVDILQRRGIPYACRDKSAAALSGAYMLQILALLEFSQAQSDYALYTRLYHKLGLYTARDTLDAVQQKSGGRRACLDILADVELVKNRNPRAATAAEEMKKQFDRMRTAKPLDAIDTACGILAGKKQSFATAEALRPKADVLRAVAQQCASIPQFLSRIEELRQITPPERSGGITLSTLHSAKGLEFDRVVLMDAYEGILPARSDSDSPEERERHFAEELRLFYVGVTRARDELEIVSAEQAFGGDISPSRFIGWLFPSPVRPAGKAAPDKKAAYTGDCSEFRKGAHVVHARFGNGTVISREGEIATIRFLSGTKKIHLPTCCGSGAIRVG